MVLEIMGLGGAALAGATQVAARAREARANSDFPPHGRMLRVDGIDIHAVVSGDGPDLVLLHGASGNAREFLWLTRLLEPHFRVIVFDRPGLGHSGQPARFARAFTASAMPPRAQARLLARATDQLGARNPLVLGHSFGGTVALAWALERPDTAGLVLLCAPSHPWPGGLGWLYHVNGSSLGGGLFVPLLSAFAPARVVENTIAAIFDPQQPPEDYHDRIGAPLTLRRRTLRSNARQVNTLYPHVSKMAAQYPGLTLPIEALHGDADTIVPLAIHSAPLAARCDAVRLTRMPGVGHMPHHADPQATLDAVLRCAERAGLR